MRIEKKIFFDSFSVSDISDGVLRTVYTRTPNNTNSPIPERISMTGKIMKRVDIRPIGDDQYMQMKRRQIESSQEPRSRAQIIQKRTNVYAPRRNHPENLLRNKAKKTTKRIRDSEEDVTRLIFEAFSKNQYIQMSGLEDQTKQPKIYLQQLLKRYCNYNSSVSQFFS